MTTLIFNTKKLISPGSVDVCYKYLVTKLFYGGLEMRLLIHLEHELEATHIASRIVIAIRGIFEEEIAPLQISSKNSNQVGLPDGEDWLTFFVDYFISNCNEPVSFVEWTDGFVINSHLQHHYISCEVSKDKMRIKKLEFGRYLPLKGDKKRRETSWTKGVFIQSEKVVLKFLQASFGGEASSIYQADFNSENIKKVSEYLTIPFNIGWTEADYRLGSDNYYKAAGCVSIHGKQHRNSFTLLDVGEHDLPFFIFDNTGQWLRTKWADSRLNQFRQHCDITNVSSINNSNHL